MDRYIGLHWADYLRVDRGGDRPAAAGRLRGCVRARRSGCGSTKSPPSTGSRPSSTRFRRLPKAVASSSPTRWLRSSLERFGLAHHFGDRLFSAAEHVPRGKPHPDIYLHAARRARRRARRRRSVLEDHRAGRDGGPGRGDDGRSAFARGRHCGPAMATGCAPPAPRHVVGSYAEVLEFVSVNATDAMASEAWPLRDRLVSR